MFPFRPRFHTLTAGWWTGLRNHSRMLVSCFSSAHVTQQLLHHWENWQYLCLTCCFFIDYINLCCLATKSYCNRLHCVTEESFIAPARGRCIMADPCKEDTWMTNKALNKSIFLLFKEEFMIMLFFVCFIKAVAPGDNPNTPPTPLRSRAWCSDCISGEKI